MSIRTVEDESTLDEALQLPTVVLAKHSTRCFISTRAMRQVTKFADSNPDVPVRSISSTSSATPNCPGGSPQS